MELRNVGILPHHMVSHPEDGVVWTSECWCPTTTLYVSKPENGDRRVLQNCGILPHHCMVSQSRRPQLECLHSTL